MYEPKDSVFSTKIQQFCLLMDSPVWKMRKGDALVSIYIFCMKCGYLFLSFHLNYNQQIAKKLSCQINFIIKQR